MAPKTKLGGPISALPKQHQRVPRCERRSNLERNTPEEEIGGGRHLRGWGIVDACNANGDLKVAASGFGRFLHGRGPKWQTRIGFPIFNSDNFGPGPLKGFYCFSILEGHPDQVFKLFFLATVCH